MTYVELEELKEIQQDLQSHQLAIGRIIKLIDDKDYLDVPDDKKDQVTLDQIYDIATGV